MDIGNGRRIPYPPVHWFINGYGKREYVVQLSHRIEIFMCGRQDIALSPEEGIKMIYETVKNCIQLGLYDTREFEPPYGQVNIEELVPDAQIVYMQPPYGPYGSAAVDEHTPEEELDEVYLRHCIGRTPASAKAIAGLMETSGMKEGACGVCLMDFETSSKLRVMPCSHCFHQQCIFTWLQLNHVCPLCRFPLPTEKQQ